MYFPTPISKFIVAVYQAGDIADKVFTFIHEIYVVATGAIPLQQGELREVSGPPFFVPETFADLKNPGKPRGQQLLHAQLR